MVSSLILRLHLTANISLKQAYPAHSHVLMNIVNNSIPGVKLPKGMKLLADKDDEGGITFETANTVYLANTRLKTIFMTCGLTGNVYPIRGNFKEIAYIDKAELSHRDETEQETEIYDEAIELTKQVIDFLDDQLKEFLEETEQEEKGFPFRLFDFNRPNYGLHGMLLYHSHLFDVQDNAIVMELKGGEEKKIVFTGDLGNNDLPLLDSPTMISNADYLIMESTYGNRLHMRNDDKAKMFLDIVAETLEKGGKVVIPSFAVGRTQEILYEIDKLKEDLGQDEEFYKKYEKIMNVPVYVDSPLAISATEVFKKNTELSYNT